MIDNKAYKKGLFMLYYISCVPIKNKRNRTIDKTKTTSTIRENRA